MEGKKTSLSPTCINAKDVMNIRRDIRKDSLESSINFLLEKMLVIKEEVMQLKRANKEDVKLGKEITKLKEENNTLKKQLMASNHLVSIVKSETNTHNTIITYIVRIPSQSQQEKTLLNYLIVKKKPRCNMYKKPYSRKLTPQKFE